jgi:hypothetical protein
MSALDYFLKANLYGLLFTSCYWLLLRKHTFFSLNRLIGEGAANQYGEKGKYGVVIVTTKKK